MIIKRRLKIDNSILVPTVCLILLIIVALVNDDRPRFKEKSQSFFIDSVDYHPSGKDNTLQVSPYWRCHLKGTNVWVHVHENREVGDSLYMLIKY